MSTLVYTGPKTSQISFPLGGIGSGAIGLAGNGRLIDWEIFNRPNKGSVNGFSHFAVRAENEQAVLAARILNSDLLPPYQGEINGPTFNSFGWGPRREYHGRPAPFRQRRVHRRIPHRPVGLCRRHLPRPSDAARLQPLHPHQRQTTPAFPPLSSTWKSPTRPISR